MHPYVHCRVIYNSQDRQAAQVPINRRVDKKAVVQKYNALLLSHKKECNFTIGNSMNGPRGYHAQ